MDAISSIVASSAVVGLILVVILLLTIAIAVALAVYNHRQPDANGTNNPSEQLTLHESGNGIGEGMHDYGEITGIVDQSVDQEPAESTDIESHVYSKINKSTSFRASSDEGTDSAMSATQVKIDIASSEKKPVWKPPPVPRNKPSKPALYENHMITADGASKPASHDMIAAEGTPKPVSRENPIIAAKPALYENQIIADRALCAVIEKSPKRLVKPPKPPKPYKPTN